jgi:muconolactone delta-isomerase
MNYYMVDISLPVNYDEGYVDLIPEQVEYINELMEEEEIISFSISVDRTKLWVILAADTEEEVVDSIAEFPLRPYFNFKVHQLSHYNWLSEDSDIPPFSLN